MACRRFREATHHGLPARRYGWRATAPQRFTSAGELPYQPVLFATQGASHRTRRLAARPGSPEAGTFEAHDAQQTLAGASPGSFLASSPASTRFGEGNKNQH
jgi:hypothetical protein